MYTRVNRWAKKGVLDDVIFTNTVGSFKERVHRRLGVYTLFQLRSTGDL
ncbi:hypothetical protein B9G39_19220 [Zooshikella ganghwensis]|uniref:Uncharacterized protein n=1 Tax=Zooshikella ganghwensis TaxID=202772 RepID=A0A4P9VRJ0_9GAMM|nr:hypothetical protein B9G39_19220 [Zooshikella ganghwensis]